MKKVLTACFLLSVIALTAQCDCPDLPDKRNGVQTVTVTNVNELQQALQLANRNNGHVEILLEDGIYNLTSNLLYIGTHMKHLTIRSKNGNADDVIIRGGGYTGNVTHIFNVAASHFTAADMTIGWVANHAIQIHSENDADSCLIQNVKFFDIREQMLKGSGNNNGSFSDDCVVQCCHFEFTEGVGFQYYTGGIDTHKGANWRVSNNTFKAIRSPDGRLAEHAIHFWNGCIGTVVENNTIIDCDRGIGFGLGQQGHQGGIIRNNMVHTSRDVGIGLESSPDSKVYNNTVVTDNYFNSIEYRFGSTQNVHIANNLVHKNIASRNGGTGVVEANAVIPNFQIFEDPQNYNYHLNGPQPNISDAGIQIDEVLEDFDCESRDNNSPYDIGADELEPISTSSSDIKSLTFCYPNPAHQVLFIESRFSGFTVEMIQVNGHHRSSFQNEGIIRLNDCPPGLYIIRLFHQGDVYQQKVVIHQE